MSRLDNPLFLPFEKWSPDLPPWRNPGAITATGVIPRNGFYTPLKKPIVFSSALASAAKGALAAVRSSDGTVYNYVGTAAKLYQISATLGWTDSTRLAGGDYTTGTKDRWELIQFGEVVIGINGWTDVPQSITLGGANFAALAGSPPKARHLAVVQSFVVMANVTDAIDGARNQRVWWSGFNNGAYWTPDLARQCSYRDLVGEGGPIQRVIGGEYGVVLRERSLARMSYIGPPGVFQFDEIEGSFGAIAPWSAVKFGRLTYYLSEDGFYAFDGAVTVPIGRDMIDKTFTDDFQSTYSENVIGAVDPIAKVVFWIYPGAGSVGGLPNKLLMFNPAVGQWASAEFNNEFLAPMYSSLPAFTDSVDALYASVDAIDGFWDDPLYAGGRLQLGFFDNSHRLTFLTGNNQAARIDTGERQINPAGRAFVSGLRPMIDTASGVTMTCLERDLVSGTVATGESDTVDTDTGECFPRSEARFHRFRMDVAADAMWNKAEGVYVTEVEASGVR